MTDTHRSNVGKWDNHYIGMRDPLLYGLSSYETIATAVASCATVADWGCGGGALRAYLQPGQHYIGIDGSRSPFAQVRADLVRFRLHTEGVVLRHVLEHNDRWQEVLHNAIDCFTKRLVVVIFTPLAQQTRIMYREPEYGHVPVICFRLGDLLAEFPKEMRVEVEPEVQSDDTAFGVETFIRAWR